MKKIIIFASYVKNEKNIFKIDIESLMIESLSKSS